MTIATTEIHRIDWDGRGEITLVHCASHATIGNASANRSGLVKLVHDLAILEIETPEDDPMALTFTAAVLDVEAKTREEREALLQSLCAQVEVFLGRTPFPELPPA